MRLCRLLCRQLCRPLCWRVLSVHCRCQLAWSAGSASSWRGRAAAALPGTQPKLRRSGLARVPSFPATPPLSPRLFAALVFFKLAHTHTHIYIYIIPFFRSDFAAEAPPKTVACRDVPQRAATCRGVCPERCFRTCRGQVCLTTCRGTLFLGVPVERAATCRDVPRRAACFLQSSPFAEKS